MKKSITLFALFICFWVISATVEAGKLKGKIQQSGDNGMISISLNGNGGTTMSSGVSNAFSFNPNAGVEVSWGNFGLGIDASTFNSKSNFDFDAYAAPLRNLDFLTVTGSGSSWRSSSIVLGPSYTIPLSISKPIPGVGIVVKKNRPGAAITISIKGGLTFNETPDFSVIANSTQKKIAYYTPSAEYQKTALTIKPSIAFRYWFSENMAASANVQYAVQTGQTAFTTGYKDLTNISLATPLSPDQFNKNISTAPNVSTTTVGPDKYLSFGIGLTYSFGKKLEGGKEGRHAINTKGTGGTRVSSGVIAETGSAEPNQQTEKHYITIPHNLMNLKENESGVTEISTNFAVGKHYITIPHDLPNRKENTHSSTNPSEKKFNPNDNTGGPSNQVFGYEEAASIELCIQFLDNQGSECDYGSGVCFINIILCEDDAGAITNGGSHVYVPTISEKLNGLPINVLLLTTTKKGKSLKGKEFNLKSDVQLSAAVAESLNCDKVSLKAGKYTYNEFNAVEIPLNMVGRKGWDGSIKGRNIAERKGINEGGLKKNEAEYVLADAEVKAIAETLVNMRKGWDGTVKGGNIAQKKGITENGLPKNEAETIAANTEVKAIAETLVNLSRQGWDGSIKGNKVAYKPTETELESVTETLENIRKGWDGSIKGNKTEYVANGADVKAIAETMVNLRKGWNGSVKGGKKNSNLLKTKHDTVKNSINNVR